MTQKTFQIQDLFDFQPKSRHKAGSGLETGAYPFFTSSQQQSKWFDVGEYKEESLILGTGGAPSVHCASNFSTSTDVFVLTPKDKRVSARYVYFYLLGHKALLERGFKGAGLKHLSTDYAKKMLIPFPVDKDGTPDLREQERIVALMDEAEELKRKRHEADKKTEDLVPALFVKMFGDPSINPFEWPVVQVGSLLQLCQYGTSKKPNTDSKGIAVLRMNNVTSTGNLTTKDLKHVDLERNEISKYEMNAGDVLFNRTNSRELVGKTAMWDGRFKAVAASYFIRLRFDTSRENPQHFTALMNLPYMKRRLFEMARGAVGQSNINAQELKAISFPLPPIELQNEFGEKVKELFALEGSRKESGMKIAALSSALSSQLFAQKKAISQSPAAQLKAVAKRVK